MRRLISRSIDYIGKRQESLGYAIASDDAILAKNKEEATAQNNALLTSPMPKRRCLRNRFEDPAVIIDEAFAEATADVGKGLFNSTFTSAQRRRFY